MLLTPLGEIKLFINNEEVAFEAVAIDRDRLCKNVNGRYVISIAVKNDNDYKKITCCLPNIDVKGSPESGEILEAIAFYKGDIKLTIGVQGEFGYYQKYHDYNGNYLDNGIQFYMYPDSASRVIQFGVCWIQPVTDENDIQTWFGADPLS